MIMWNLLLISFLMVHFKSDQEMMVQSMQYLITFSCSSTLTLVAR